jgi:hypothetical protein
MKKTPLTETCLYVPRLYLSGIPESGVLDELSSRGIDPFETTAMALAPYFPIQYLPVSIFNAAIPHNQDYDSF